MNENVKISVVSPVYSAEHIILELVKQVTLELEAITTDYELILIEDCGGDKSWDKIEEACAANRKVKGFRFSRNFGQHAAIKAGLSQVTGGVAIVIDCDLQDNPKYFKDLLDKYYEGNDVVYTYKQKRNHSKFKNITAAGFNLALNYLLDNKNLEADKNVGAYSLISRKVINAFLSYNDYQFHYLLVLRWLGFKSAFVEIEHQERFEGESSYTLRKLLAHASVAIIYQSDKLLRISVYFGAFVSSLSFIFGLYIVISYFVSNYQSGWASIVISILFSLGIILMSIGILGLYLGRLFEQVKNRPQYVFDKKLNVE